MIKNIEFAKAINLAEMMEYQPGKVVSVTLSQNEAVSITLFAFAQGEGLSTHEAAGDALVYILDGQAKITVGDNIVNAASGQVVVMPKNVPHGLEAIENFKMLLVVVR